MAAATPTYDTTSTAPRFRLKVTRIGVFSILFLAFGVWLVIGGLSAIAPDAITTLTFGANLPRLPIPTQAYAIIVGIFYAASGALGLAIPNGKLKTILLLIGGLLIIPTVLIIAAANNSTNVTTMLSVSIRLATPVVLGALAGIWCERSGVTNIAIEGMMLTGACLGFVVFSQLAGSMPAGNAQIIGLAVAVLAGGLMALLLAWLSITFKTNQIVAGTVINILAVGLTSYIRREVLFSSEAGRETLQSIPIPGLSQIPVIGEVFFDGRPIFYSMFILLAVTHVMLYFTRWGLRTRAVGENPHAAANAGISVTGIRYAGVLLSGAGAGAAGGYLVLAQIGLFRDTIVVGQGFIALAIVIFGRWRPVYAACAALAFGAADALQLSLQLFAFDLPPQLLLSLPYVLTVIAVSGLIGKASQPAALMEPYRGT